MSEKTSLRLRQPLAAGPIVGRPWARPFRGELLELVIHSQLLRDNHLGDPTDRPLWVYLPPAYREEEASRFPTVYLLQGMSGQLDMWRRRVGFRPTTPELFDELFSNPSTSPCIVVFVDCWTSLGGSQFLDSPGTGPYHSYLCQEVVPAIDSSFRTLADRAHRAVAGKSSGGYGALVSALLRPDLFGALASHAGDALFEYCYQREFPEVVRELRDRYQGSYADFWTDFRSRPALSRPADMPLVNAWCMAACYSAAADGHPELPFDETTGVMREEVWRRWLARDPVRMIAARAESARSLLAIYLEGGRRDEYFLDVAAGAVAAAFRAVGQERVRLELFDAGHGDIEYRYPIALRHLAEAMAS